MLGFKDFGIQLKAREPVWVFLRRRRSEERGTGPDCKGSEVVACQSCDYRAGMYDCQYVRASLVGLFPKNQAHTASSFGSMKNQKPAGELETTNQELRIRNELRNCKSEISQIRSWPHQKGTRINKLCISKRTSPGRVGRKAFLPVQPYLFTIQALPP